jgi:hypothetical protein
MSLLDLPSASLPAIQALRASADVIEVDEGPGFYASVLVVPGHTAVARLSRSLDGSPHEGAVLRWTMLHATSLYEPGLYFYRLPRGHRRTLPNISILRNAIRAVLADRARYWLRRP